MLRVCYLVYLAFHVTAVQRRGGREEEEDGGKERGLRLRVIVKPSGGLDNFIFILLLAHV